MGGSLDRPGTPRHWTPVRCRRLSGPTRTDLSAATRPGGRTLRWDNLDAIQQSLLVVASREYTLDRACGSWANRPRRSIAMEMIKQAALILFDNDLIGFYRVDVGYPDLGEVDVRLIFDDQTHWDCEQQNARKIGVFSPPPARTWYLVLDGLTRMPARDHRSWATRTR